MKIVDIRAVGRERTDEEKRRRHLYGDKGAKFSQSKRMCILPHGVMGAITTFATKDCLVCEVYEWQLTDEIAPTLLATDYKSPYLVIEICE